MRVVHLDLARLHSLRLASIFNAKDYRFSYYLIGPHLFWKALVDFKSLFIMIRYFYILMVGLIFSTFKAFAVSESSLPISDIFVVNGAVGPTHRQPATNQTRLNEELEFVSGLHMHFNANAPAFSASPTVSSSPTATPFPSATKSRQQDGRTRSSSQPLQPVTAVPAQNPLEAQMNALFAMARGDQDVHEDTIRNIQNLIETENSNLFPRNIQDFLLENWVRFPFWPLMLINEDGESLLAVAFKKDAKKQKIKDVFITVLLGDYGEEVRKRLSRWLNLEAIDEKALKAIAQYLQILIEKERFRDILLVAYFLKDKLSESDYHFIFAYDVSVRTKTGNLFKKKKKQSLKAYFEKVITAAKNNGSISALLYNALMQAEMVMQGIQVLLDEASDEELTDAPDTSKLNSKLRELGSVPALTPISPDEIFQSLRESELLSQEAINEIQVMLNSEEADIQTLGRVFLELFYELSKAESNEARLEILKMANEKFNYEFKGNNKKEVIYGLGIALAKLLNWGWLLDANGLNLEALNDRRYHRGAEHAVRAFLELAINIPVNDENDQLVGNWLGAFLTESIKEALEAYRLMLDKNQQITENNNPIQRIINRIEALKPVSWGNRFDAIIKDHMATLDTHCKKKYNAEKYQEVLKKLREAMVELMPYVQAAAVQVAQVVHENPAVQQVVTQRCPWLPGLWAAWSWVGSFYNSMGSAKPKQE